MTQRSGRTRVSERPRHGQQAPSAWSAVVKIESMRRYTVSRGSTARRCTLLDQPPPTVSNSTSTYFRRTVPTVTKFNLIPYHVIASRIHRHHHLLLQTSRQPLLKTEPCQGRLASRFHEKTKLFLLSSLRSLNSPPIIHSRRKLKPCQTLLFLLSFLFETVSRPSKLKLHENFTSSY